MKKTILLALAIVVGAAFNGASAAKKKKKDKTETAQQTVTLSSSSDSLSYVAGMALSNGLITFLQQSEKFDTTYMADFIRGIEQLAAAHDDPHAKAFATGVSIASRVQNQMLPGMKGEFTDTPDSVVTTLVYRGFVDALQGDTTFFDQGEAERLFNEKREANKAAKNEKLYGQNRAAGEQYLAENAKRDSVVTLPSGLQYKVIKAGTGAKPSASDRVEVHYEGRLIDGTVFDSSTRHGQKPASFRVDQVIKGWTEALTMMPEGSKWQLFIPQELAYGSRDAGQIKPYSALIFDVELVKVIPHKEVVNPHDPRKSAN